MMSTNSSYGLDTVNISFLSDENGEKRPYPLLITPRWNSSKEFLAAWAHQNRSWINTKLTECGAILIRDFDMNTAIDMEETILGYTPILNATYRGTSPRNVVGGSRYVFSAAEVPVHYPIAQHLEMSMLAAPPRELFFGCLRASTQKGGETAVADFRAVVRDLNPELRQKLADKGIRYRRTHHKKGTYFTYDVSDMLGWTQLFHTEDKAEVERICHAEGTPFEWENGDTYVSEWQDQAFQLHPITKEPVWFNHIQVFHWTTFPHELWFAYKRTQDIRLFLQFLFVTIFTIIKYGLLKHRMGLTCSFGDGEPISVWDAFEIRRAIHKNMVFNRWKKGDLLFLDNFSTSHGRQPTYDKGRTIVVAMAPDHKKANETVAFGSSSFAPNNLDKARCASPVPSLTDEHDRKSHKYEEQCHKDEEVLSQ